MLKLIRLSSYIIISLSFPLIISSCSTFDPPLTVPVYGHIDSFHFSVPVDSATKQGSASATIPYVWVYLDDNPVGAFQMPCTFPMVAGNGMHTIEVYPGVIPVGGTSPASIYTFYKFYSVTLNVQQGKTYKIEPTSVYNSWVKFPYKEDFNTGETPGGPPKWILNYHGGGNKSAGTTTTMVVTADPKLVFQGGGSGMVVVNQTHNYYIGVTDTTSLINNGSTAVCVELNYKSTASFSIGLFEGDTTTQVQPIVIFPTTGWDKMYYTLNTTISTYSVQPYSIYFAIGRDSADGHTADTLLLDNIKIVD